MASVTVSEDILKTAMKNQDYVNKLAGLLGIKKDGLRWVDKHGNPVGASKIEAVTQVVIREQELIRVRDRIWESELSQEEKVLLTTLLLLFEQLVSQCTKEADKKALNSTIIRIAQNLKELKELHGVENI